MAVTSPVPASPLPSRQPAHSRIRAAASAIQVDAGAKGGFAEHIERRGAGWLTELHTHDARGVMHIEAQKPRDFVLGQFVSVWGVFLSSRCMGAYCDGLTWYVDGKRQSGNPQDLVLKPHSEIIRAGGMTVEALQVR
jgi:hypothetical protein